MLLAVTRGISESFADCALTFLERAPIDVVLARRQHGQFTTALSRLGGEVVSLPPIPDLPDATFVEDTAVVLDEVAVITAPALETRRREVATVAQTLAAYRPLSYVRGDASLEGGDVLTIGRTLFAGLSTRTNAAGVRQLQDAVAPYGYEVRPVAFQDCLHLKTAFTYLGQGTLLANPAWIDPRQMGELDVITVDPSEPGAANALAIGNTLLFPQRYPRTRERLEAAGFRVETVDISELQKAEAGVTCSVILFATYSDQGSR